MHRVTKRAWVMMVFVVVLLGGMVFFLYEYAAKSADWVISTGSPHVYNGGNTGSGVITDRDGLLLLDTRDEKIYSQDGAIRRSTLHWLGDRSGNIRSAAAAHYAKELAGFDLVNGVYTYGGAGGQAVLTLSAQAQKAALTALGDRKGTVAVYNYKTGELLCAVSTPTFDPDNVPDIEADTTGRYDGVYLNRFVQSTYIPGSIFKIVTTAAALETVPGIEDMTFTCTGLREYGIDRVTCERAHGGQDLKTALANSCNCAFAEISALVGQDTMMEYVERFGLTDSLSFDGVTAAKGSYDVSGAAPVELAWSCIGQYTDQINPCTFLTFIGAVANGGTAVKPYVVSEITVGEDTTYRAKRETLSRMLSGDLAQTLQEMMRNNVVTKYGADRFAGLTVCAKSGTSELGGGLAPNAMFTGFVMEEEYPLAFIVVVENGGYGASTCIPVIAPVLAACKVALDGE